MKTTTHPPQSGALRPEFQPDRELRCQIFRQPRAGNFMPQFETNSAVKAVEMFALLAPASWL